MQLVRRHSLLVVPFVASLMAIGCGQSSAVPSPTGPTGSLRDSALTADQSVEAPASALGSGEIATLVREHKGKEGDNSEETKQDKEGDEQRGKPEKGTRGELSGFVTIADGTSLTVRGITVTPAPGAVIRHGNRTVLFADIVVGNHVQARGTTTVGGLLATEIKVERTGRRGDDDEDEGEVQGVVSGIVVTTTCPVLTFMVGTKTVTTTATTVFEGVLCTALANGAIVEVEGMAQPDGSIVATKVEVGGAELENDEDGAKAEGLVSGLGGACPALSFMIGAKQVTTTAATKFDDVTCATLANGMKVEVKGVLQGDGSIAATKVELD